MLEEIEDLNRSKIWKLVELPKGEKNYWLKMSLYNQKI